MTPTETKAAPTTGNGKVQDGNVWEALRAPFPPEQIEKLPATDKRPELDYVSAAHVIDRILSVDPTWTWTWGAADPETGNPSKHLSLTREDDGSISLWMALTISGVTRTDVGYVSPGKYGLPDEPLKHVVSDAITRCARLHGIALDLWIGTPRPVQNGASIWPTRHETDGSRPQGPTCPTEGCAGTLRQRTTKNGDPFLVCSTGKNGCGLSPLWETTIELYLEGKEDFENVIYPEEGASDRHVWDPKEVPQTTLPSTPKDDYIAEIKRLVAGLNSDVVKDVILSLPQGHAILSPVSGGGWKVNGAALKTAGEAVQIEIITALTSFS